MGLPDFGNQMLTGMVIAWVTAKVTVKVTDSKLCDY